MEQGTLLFIASWKNAGVYPSRESRALLSSPLTTGKFCFALTGRRVFFNSFDKHPSRGTVPDSARGEMRFPTLCSAC